MPSADPYEAEQPLRRLRFSDGHFGWFTTKYSSCKAIMADARFAHNPLHPLAGDDGGFSEALYGPELAGNLLRLDPPEHTRLRRMLTKYFTVAQVEQKRPAVERIVAEHVRMLKDAGPPVDFVRMFALPVPSTVLCDFFGVASSNRESFERPAETIADTLGASLEEKRAANDALYAFAWKVIEEKRERPRQDLISDVIATGELSDDELKGLVRLLFVAGHHTTATMFVTSVFFLLSERGRWEAACAAPSEVDGLVEELLRFLMTANTDMPRTALEDVEIDGVSIEAGEAIAVVPGRPGGDLEAFPALGDFDPAHDSKAHLAFGQGRHMCLGQHLARLELQAGLEALIRHFPTLRLAQPLEETGWYSPDGLPFNPNAQLLKDRLPVTW
jgi:cytochrome P450